MSKYLFVSTITVLLLVQSCIVLAAIEITGTITAKRGDLVKVDFTPNKTAGPKVGDEVRFSYTLSGLPVTAGTGKVTEVEGNIVWIKPEKKNLKLKMKAVIYATGLTKKKKVVVKNSIPPLHPCDEQAGDPWDNQRLGPSVKLFSIDTAKAIEACEDAVKKYPATSRFLYQLARANYADNKSTTAFFNFIQQHYAALSNYGAVQFNIGVMYDNGYGVAEDDVEAVKWYRKSVEQGYAHAQFNLGGKYQDGKGVEQNYAEAIKWFSKAAEQNLAKAQYNLALLYYKGLGVPRSRQQAVHWLKKAALNGNEDAKKSLVTLGE